MGATAPLSMVATTPTFDVRSMPGVTAPLGFFDPLNFCGDASEGKIKFYREAEIKHGRVAMLASVGFVVGESFHPMWGGNIDVPSYIAFQETPLQSGLPAVAFLIAIHEVLSIFTFNPQGDADQGAEQRPAGDDRVGWHGRPGARARRQAVLTLTA